MAYVSIPSDLNKVKSKVLFNLTKRQLLCFGCGALVGAPLFFLLRKPLGTSTAAMAMMLVMLPAFLLAMYERNGQPLEVVLRNIINVCFLRPKQRPYKTDNFYAVLERQSQLDMEVYQIVSGTQKPVSPSVREKRKIGGPAKGSDQALPRGEKGNRGVDRAGQPLR